MHLECMELLEVVTANYDDEELINGCTIKYVKAKDWLTTILQEYGF